MQTQIDAEVKAVIEPKKVIVQAEEAATNAVAQRAKSMKEECEADLAEAIPALNSAVQVYINIYIYIYIYVCMYTYICIYRKSMKEECEADLAEAIPALNSAVQVYIYIYIYIYVYIYIYI